MHRLISVALAVLVTVALLGACSDDDGATQEGGSTDVSVGAPGRSEGPTPQAVTVEHDFGTTEVPADPQAIAALGEEFLLADLFDLGLGDRVILTTSTIGDTTNLEALGFDTAGIELFSATEADLEGLFQAQPDLILAPPYVIEAVGYDTLAAIAPTVPLIQVDDWEQNYRNVAAAFGDEVAALAEERLAAYDEAVAVAGEQLDADERTISVATVYSGANLVAWAEGPIDVPAALLDMGFTLVPDTDDGATDASGRIQLSLEQIGLLAGDHLVLMQTTGVDGEDTAVEDVTSSELWQRLPAVQADQVVTVDRLGYPGLPGRMALIDVLRAELG